MTARLIGRRAFFELGSVAASGLIVGGCSPSPDARAESTAGGPVVRSLDERVSGRLFAQSGTFAIHPALERIECFADDGSESRFLSTNRAYPVAAIRHGESVFVLASGTGQILVFQGETPEPASFGPERPSRLLSPGDMALAPNGLVVADTLNHRLQHFDFDGSLRWSVGSFGLTDGFLNGPTSVAAWQDALYVVDAGNVRIRVYGSDGRYTRSFGARGNGLGQMLGPTCVRVAEDGTLYVVDPISACVHVFDVNGTFRTRLSPKLPDGRALAPTWISIAPVTGVVTITGAINS